MLILDMNRFYIVGLLAGLLLNVSCTPATPSDSKETQKSASRNCIEPENPYDEGSGHYAGYEWAQRNGSPACAGSSQSFVEGCEEYETQESEYEECEAQNKK